MGKNIIIKTNEVELIHKKSRRRAVALLFGLAFAAIPAVGAVGYDIYAHCYSNRATGSFAYNVDGDNQIKVRVTFSYESTDGQRYGETVGNMTNENYTTIWATSYATNTVTEPELAQTDGYVNDNCVGIKVDYYD